MIPKIKDDPDLSNLKQAVREYLEYLESDERHEDSYDDYENAIFEAAMETFYGENIWGFINAAIA